MSTNQLTRRARRNRRTPADVAFWALIGGLCIAYGVLMGLVGALWTVSTT